MASTDRTPMVTIENANILRGAWRNFSGAKGMYNEGGKRSFHILLPDDVAQDMARDGFNVKELPPREEDDPMGYRLEVAVNYEVRPPQVYFISGGQRTLLDQGAIDILDYADIAQADVMINPYRWDVNGKTGIKAYLHKLFVTVAEDDLDRKYADIPMQGNSDFDSSGPRFREE